MLNEQDMFMSDASHQPKLAADLAEAGNDVCIPATRLMAALCRAEKPELPAA